MGSTLGNSPRGCRARAEKQDGQKEKLSSKAVVTKASVDPTVSSGAIVRVGDASEHPELGLEDQNFVTLSLNCGLDQVLA